MSAHVIEKTVNIAAPAAAVWELIISPPFVREWADAFSEGTYVESDFRLGSEVIWKDKNGNTGARGIVTANHEMELLEVSFYDDVNPDPKQLPGLYKERYILASEAGKTQLTISAGPLPEEHVKIHEPLWNAAVEKLKSFAEQTIPARGMDA